MSSDFLEILSEGALEELKQVEALVKSLVTDIKSINSFKASNTPSGADNNIKKINQDYTDRGNILKSLGDKINEVAKNQNNLTAKTKEAFTAEQKLTEAVNKTWNAQDKKAKQLSEEERAYNKVLAKQQSLTKNIRDLVIETGKESEAVKKLQTQLDALNTELLQAEQASKKYAIGASSLATPVLLYAEAQKKATQATKEANAEKAKSNAMISKQMTGQMVESVNAIGKPTESLKRLGDYYRDLEKTSLAEEKLSNVYNKIQAKVNGMIPVYNNLQAKQALGLTLSHKEEAQLILLTNRLNKYQEVLKGTDIVIGRHGREVGNYAKGNSNLAFSISQISRELPNFGQSFAIGVLSLTNNVGFLLDSVKQVREENEILKKSGQSTQSVFKQILSSIFSWQTLLYIGIGLISAYSNEIKDFAVNLFNANNGIKSIKGSQEDLSESFKKGNENALKEVSTLKVLYETATNENLSREQRNRAVKKMQDLYPLYLQNFSNEEIMAGKAKIAYENLALAIFNKARASAIQEQLEKNASERLEEELKLEEDIVKARKEYQEQLKNPKPLIGITSDIYGSNDNILATEKEYTDILAKNLVNKKNNLDEFQKASLNNDNLLLKQASKYYKDEAELAKNAEIVTARETPKQKAERLKREAKERKDAQIKLEKDQAKASYDRKISDLEREKEIVKDKFEFEKQDVKKRLALSLELSEKELDIVEAQFLEESKGQEKYSDLWTIAENKRVTERENILAESAKRTTDIYRKMFEDNVDLSDGFESMLNPEDRAELNRQKEQTEKPKSGEDRNIQKKLEQLKAESEGFVDDFGTKHEGFLDVLNDAQLSTFNELSEAYKSALENDNDALADSIKTKLDLYKDYGEGLKSYFQSFFDEFGSNLGLSSVFEIIDGGLNKFGEDAKAKSLLILEGLQEVANFVSNNARNEAEADYRRLEETYNKQLEFAGDSEEAKAKLLEDYNAEKRKVAKKEFEAEKKLKLINIAIDTAQAAIASWAKTGFPWASAAAIAFGTLQASIVARQQFPEYFVGTPNAEAGLAWTNERGAEIHTDKKGVVKDFGDNRGARLTMMEAGDKVYTAEQTKRMMFNKDLNNIMMDNGIGNAPKIVVNNTGMTEQQMESVMMRTLGSMAIESTNIDVNGFTKVISKGHSKTIEHTARITGMGLKIGR